MCLYKFFANDISASETRADRELPQHLQFMNCTLRDSSHVRLSKLNIKARPNLCNMLIRLPSSRLLFCAQRVTDKRRSHEETPCPACVHGFEFNLHIFGKCGCNYQKKFLHSKSREKKSCTVGQGKKNRASLSTRRILLDQMKNLSVIFSFERANENEEHSILPISTNRVLKR